MAKSFTMDFVSLFVFLFIFHFQPDLVASADVGPHHTPVRSVAKDHFVVGDNSFIPIYLSKDWSKPLPRVERAILMLHGMLRNADEYFKTAQAAQSSAGQAGQAALLIVPQFLADIDIKPNRLPPETLRWTVESWTAGESSIGPSHVSSFKVIDAILAHLADRGIFPNLKQVVIAGHSGGGQVAQRYAIAGKGEQSLVEKGIDVRYVVANPSTYAYFNSVRPEAKIAATCAGYNNWKYGMGERPAYLASPTPSSLEKVYLTRHVIYLLGTKDTDTQDPAMDKSCMAEAQGPHRLARGLAFFKAMKARGAGASNHSLLLVTDVGHDAEKMFASSCGLKALFDLPGCAAH